MAEKIYALYKGEQNLMDGTLEQIARARGISYETARFMTSPVYKKRVENAKRGRLELVEITEESE